MKRLFSFAMLLGLALVTFAFNTPSAAKKAAFEQSYYLDGSTWVEGSDAENCTGSDDPCEFTSPVAISNPAAFTAIENRFTGNTDASGTVFMDPDGSGGPLPADDYQIDDVSRLAD